MDGIKQRTFTAYNVKVLSDKSGVILPSCNIDMVYIWAKTMSLKNNKLKTQTYPRYSFLTGKKIFFPNMSFVIVAIIVSVIFLQVNNFVSDWDQAKLSFISYTAESETVAFS